MLTAALVDGLGAGCRVAGVLLVAVSGEESDEKILGLNLLLHERFGLGGFGRGCLRFGGMSQLRASFKL